MDFTFGEITPEMLLPDKEVSAVGTEPVRCYRKADEKIIEILTEFKDLTLWKHSSKYKDELPGEYIFTTLEPKDILCDSKCGSLAREDYLVAKAGIYKIELVEKDLSREAYTYLYDDGDNKEIPDHVVREISSLNAIPKQPIKCIIFADNCVWSVDDELMTAKYTYCHYLDDEENIFKEEYYIITVEPENVLFSSLHSDKYIYNYCDLIIKPGIYTLEVNEDEGDDVESMVSKLDDEITLLKIRIENNKNNIKELMLQQSQNEIDLHKVVTNLSLIVNYLKDREINH